MLKHLVFFAALVALGTRAAESVSVPAALDLHVPDEIMSEAGPVSLQRHDLCYSFVGNRYICMTSHAGSWKMRTRFWW